MNERSRERIIELVRKMSAHTVENGCTPGEAAKFAAKVAEYIEQHNITEAELRASKGLDPEEVEVCENTFRTGKKAFNPGMTQVFSALAQGFSCKVIMLNGAEAVYGIIGDPVDADYVCQLACTLVPSLQAMARLDGAEHGYEKAGLVRWSNQYLTGAAEEILNRLLQERRDRSKAKEESHRASGTGLVLVTGETIALAKEKATLEAFDRLYPRTRTVHSRTAYNHDARNAGREAGKRVGLNLTIE